MVDASKVLRNNQRIRTGCYKCTPRKLAEHRGISRNVEIQVIEKEKRISTYQMLSTRVALDVSFWPIVLNNVVLA